MTEIELDADRLVARIRGVDKVLALKSELTVALTHIKGAEVSPPDVRQRWRNPLRMHIPGTDLPFVVMAGSFLFRDGQHAFWDVHNPDRTIVVRLAHEPFDCLVLEVADPEATVAGINGAIGLRPSSESPSDD